MGKKKSDRVRIAGEPVKVHRSELHAAAYNPRVIGPEEFKGLCKSIRVHGLVELPVWNRRTGNIVAGHQRLKAADKVYGTDDWEVPVISIDVDEDEEKKLNVKLNSEGIRGDWDLEVLDELKRELSADWEKDFGLPANFGAVMGLEDSEFGDLLSDTEEVAETKEILGDIKEDRANAEEKLKEEQSADFFFVVVCRSQKDKQNTLRGLGVPEHEEYVSAERIKLALER